MRTLYLECNMGTAGDILMSALSGLIPDPDGFIEKMNRLGLPGVHVAREQSIKSGISGWHITVTVNGEEEEECENETGHAHAHRGMHDIWHIVQEMPVSEQVKKDVLAVYRLIAKAESEVHGRPVEEIHFHEVGAMDAIADIVGVALLIEELKPDRILSSPIHVGFGQVRCAHGILPVPTPATAAILRGIPIYSGTIRGELCTPTGAALIKHFAERFSAMPPMTVSAVSYGMGKRDFEAINCMRAFLGETEADGERELYAGPNDEIAELSCNLDDMTGEQIGFALEMLLENGALDAFVQPIQMKKNRPGQMLICLCTFANADRMAKLMLAHTTTFGVRRTLASRYILDRETVTAETPYGPIRIKTGRGYGVEKSKPEYEDVARAARENGIGFRDILNVLNLHSTFPETDAAGRFDHCSGVQRGGCHR